MGRGQGRRHTEFPHRVGVALREREGEAIAALAVETGLAQGGIAREAIERGLPRAIEAIRRREKKRQKAKGNT